MTVSFTKVVMAGSLALGLFSAAPAFADSFIVVNGQAERGLEPNLVTLNVEVWSKSNNAKQAQGLAANEFQRVKKTFETFKIKKEDIRTDNYSLNPEYEYDQKLRQNKLVGFRVVQNLSVTLRNVAEAGPFLDALVVEQKKNDSGVNVNSLTWDSDQRAKTEIATLGDAVRASKVKAEEIAKAAGVKLKGVSKISHATPIDRPMPVMRNFALKSAMDESAGTELSGGQVKVRVEITAEYEIN